MDNFDEPLLRYVLSFLGNAKDFRSCEKALKVFQTTLQDDVVWDLCVECKPEEYLDHPYDKRELALIPLAVESMKKWNKIESPILEVLQVSGWRRLVQNIMSHLLPQDIRDYNFNLRGDTSAVLLRIVEENIHGQLSRALLLSSYRNGPFPGDHSSVAQEQQKTKFMTVVVKDFKTQNAFGFPGDPASNEMPTADEQASWNQVIESGGTFLGDIDRALRNKLVCSVAFRAGIPKMDYKMYGLVWTVLIKTILVLLTPVCHLAVGEVDPRALRRSYISSTQPTPELPKRVVSLAATAMGEAIRTIPPLPRLLSEKCCPQCRRIPVIYTLVPHQIEMVAKQLLMTPHKILGSEWHTEGPSATRKELTRLELTEAESHYNFVQEEESDDKEQEEDVVSKNENFPSGIPNDPTAHGIHLDPPPIETDDNSEDDDEAYEEESEDEEEPLGYDEGVDELVFVSDGYFHQTSTCTHPNGFVPTASVPNIIL